MADIKLQNSDGTYTSYTGVDSIILPTPSGGTEIFTQGGSGGNVTFVRSITYGSTNTLSSSNKSTANMFVFTTSYTPPTGKIIKEAHVQAWMLGFIGSTTLQFIGSDTTIIPSVTITNNVVNVTTSLASGAASVFLNQPYGKFQIWVDIDALIE